MAWRKARDLKKEARWRKVVAGQRRSGETVRHYCRDRALSESSFWFWKRELARRDAEQPTGRSGGQSSARRPGRQRLASSLVPVTIGPALGARTPIEVLLPHGVSVRVAAGCDEAMLRMVLAALESGS